MTIHAELSQYSELELQRWLHLRAIEWCAWPVFLSQPILPLLLIWFPAVSVLVAVVAAEFLWRFVRYSFISPRLASAGATFVVFLKWPCAIGAAIYLAVQHRYPVALVPEPWVQQPEAARILPTIIDAFLRGTSRVTAVMLRWEEQQLLRPDGALILYKFRLERGSPPKVVAPPLEPLLNVLAGPATAAWVSFQAIAEQVMVK